jgi:regulator of nucleoside diphosphate kinase
MFEVYMASEAQIVITERDFEQLEALLNSLPKCNHSGACRLMGELQRADVVASDKLTPNIVTMNSRVTFTVLSTGETFTYTLVYPKDTDGCADKISVLSPMGSALLGLSVGQEIEWFISTTKTIRVRINAVEYPEQ